MLAVEYRIVSRRVARRTIVSAADHRYFRTLCQLLLSAARTGASAAGGWIVFDLGLADDDRAFLRARFPWCRLERFPFEAHPPHVRVLAFCAWKPIAIETVLVRDGGDVLWLDSADLLHDGVDAAFDRIARDGVLTLVGQSPLSRWCHETTRRFMQVPAEDLTQRCRSAGVLGFSAESPVARDLVAEWRRFALIPECLAPPSASRANHRYDQAVLTNLLYAFARERGLVLGQDEVDSGSTRPVHWVSTRRIVASWVPLALDPIARASYGLYKFGDRLVLRARAGTLVRDGLFALENALTRSLAELARRRATRRGRRFLASKASLAGRRCHCDPDLPVHFVHSEGLREACDVVIDDRSNVESPERPHIPLPLIVPFAREIARGDVVHVKTDHLPAFVRDILPRTAGPIVLVTGDSDISPVRRFEHLLDDDRLLHWFAQNCDVIYDHPRLTRLPIGLDNPVYTKLEKRLGFLVAMLLGRIPLDASISRNEMGNQALLQSIASRARRIHDKPARALCTFHRSGVLVASADRISDRREAYAQLRHEPDCHFIERRLPQAEYWRIHDEFAFEVSPRGTGLDCFRTWECLLLNTIPIVKSSPLDALYRQEGYPVVVVESYREISTDTLTRWKTDLAGRFGPDLIRKLATDYWVQRFRDAARSRHDAAQARVDAGASV
ncbi:MAG: hypothetical protein HY047_14290 [Acidobacteria bacterium]|nr:hypothetical protein [Acidobacteriota bacterium]